MKNQTSRIKRMISVILTVVFVLHNFAILTPVFAYEPEEEIIEEVITENPPEETNEELQGVPPDTPEEEVDTSDPLISETDTSTELSDVETDGLEDTLTDTLEEPLIEPVAAPLIDALEGAATEINFEDQAVGPLNLTALKAHTGSIFDDPLPGDDTKGAAVIVEKGGNKYLSVSSPDTNDAKLKLYFPKQTSGKVKISFKYMIEKPTTSNTPNVSVFAEDNTCAFMLLKNSGNLLHRSPGNTNIVVKSCAAGTWYDVSVEFNLDTKKYVLTVDGVPQSEVAFRNSTGNLQYISIGGGKAGSEACYVDDIVLPFYDTGTVEPASPWPMYINFDDQAPGALDITALKVYEGSEFVDPSIGSSAISGPGTATIVDNSGNKYLSVTSPTGNDAKVKLTFPKKTKDDGIVNISFSFMPETTGTGTPMISVHSEGGAAAFSILKSGSNICYKSSTGNNVSAVAYSANKWYNISFALDIAAKTCKLTIDDTILGPFSFRDTTITDLQFITIGGGSSGTETCCVDNIVLLADDTLTEPEEPQVTLPLSYFMNFNGNKTGKLTAAPYENSELLNANGATFEIVEKTESDKYLTMTSPSGSDSSVKFTFDKETARAIVAYKFMPDKTQNYANVSVMSGTTSIFSFMKSGGNMIHRPGNVDTILTSAAADKWYDVCIDFDVSNKQYTIYFEGKKLETGPFNFRNSATGLDSINVSKGSASVNGYASVDDLLFLPKSAIPALPMIMAIEPPSEKDVLIDTTFEDLGLPSEVNAIVNGESTAIPVTWEVGIYNPAVIGEYTITGTFDFDSAEMVNIRDLSPTITINVCTEIIDDTTFDTVRNKWIDYLTGADYGAYGLTDSDVQGYIAVVDAKADDSLAKLQAWKVKGGPERTCVYEDLTVAGIRSGTDVAAKNISSQVTLTYDRLKMIAQAYATKGSKYYKEPDIYTDIIEALDIMYNNKHYSLETKSTSGTRWGFGNWYDWEIGTPLRYLDLLMFLYDDLTVKNPTALAKYLAVAKSSTVYKVDRTYANRVWKGSVVMELAVMLKDADKLAEAKDGLKQVFALVTSGDGFYADGSFVQHDYYSYTGGYGKAYIAMLAPLMYNLKDTPWELHYDDNVEKTLFDMVFEAYEPLIYNGVMMDMVRCREISRFNGQDFISGSQTIRAIITLSTMMEGDQKARCESMIKYMLSDEQTRKSVFTDPIDYFLEYYVSAFAMLVGKDILNDNSIQPRGPLERHKRYASMDRVVHLREAFGFGIAMFSSRIRNYELTNAEPLRGWHIADGMTFLYNGDKEKYSDGFWAAVDHARLPGTTVERTSDGLRADAAGSGAANTYGYAGGTDMQGLYGISALQYQGLGTGTSRNGVKVNKSWFMFGDEIVALGSGITSTTGQTVESIIENYKIKDDDTNVIRVNGVADSGTGVKDNVNYIHMQGNVADGTADVGYYFPISSSITMLRQQEAKPWTVMNLYEKFISNKVETKNFQTFWFNHGTKPTDNMYAYVILPGKTDAETAEYAADSNIQIIENSVNAQAVKSKSLNMTGVNFIKNQAYTVGNLTAKSQASVMLKYSADELEISVSDPTQARSTVEIELEAEVGAVISKDSAITVTKTDSKLKLVVNTAGAAGKSFHIVMEKLPSSECKITATKAPANAALSETAITANVANAVSSQAIAVNISDFATWKLYSDSACTEEIANKAMPLSVGSNVAYVKVTAQNGIASKIYEITINRATASMSNKCDITAVTAPADAVLSATTIKANVANAVSSQAISVNVSDFAIWGLYRDRACTQAIANKTMLLSVGSNVAYVKVTAQNGTAAKIYEVTITRAAAQSSGDSGSSSDSSSDSGSSTAVPNTTKDLTKAAVTESIVKLLEDKTPYSFGPIVFNNIPEGYWGKSSIDYLSARGILSGNPDGTFDFDAEMSRGEYCEILVKAFGLLPGEKAKEFSDVAAKDPYKQFIDICSSLGFVNGYPDGTFRSNQPISRQDMVLLAYLAARQQGVVFTAVREGSLKDLDTASDYARDSIDMFYKAGIVNGTGNGKFEPKKMAAKGQMAAFISAITKILEK